MGHHDMHNMTSMGHSMVPSSTEHNTMDMHMHEDHQASNNMSHHGGMMAMDHMMKMYFHTGVHETVLFKCWKTDSVGTMLASCIGIFIIALLYEGLKFFREHLYRKYYSDVNFSSVAVTSSSGSSGEMEKVLRSKILSLPHLLQTFLHVCQLVISYFLMLIFMTFNVWLCLAVALGAGAGYFIFGWKKAIIVNVTEHCH